MPKDRSSRAFNYRNYTTRTEYIAQRQNTSVHERRNDSSLQLTNEMINMGYCME